MNNRVTKVAQKELRALLQQLKGAGNARDVLKKEHLAYLENLKGNTLSGRQQVGLYFLLAYGYAGLKEQRMAVHYFDLAFALSDGYFPQPALLTKVYLEALQTVVAQTGDHSLVGNCREWSDRFNFGAYGGYPDLAAIYYHGKDYETAVTLWQQHLEAAPASVNTWHLLIHTLFHHLRRYETAIATYKRAAASVQQVPFLQLLAGHCYKATGEYAEAATLYKAAISAVHPTNVLPMLLLAELYAKYLNDDAAAVQWYRKAIDEKGSSQELLQAKVSYLCFLVDRQQHVEAISLLLVMEQQLNYNYERLTPEVLNRVAWCLYILNTRWDLAEQFSLRAVELDPHSLDNAGTLVAILIRLKKWEALRCYMSRFPTSD